MTTKPIHIANFVFDYNSDFNKICDELSGAYTWILREEPMKNNLLLKVNFAPTDPEYSVKITESAPEIKTKLTIGICSLYRRQAYLFRLLKYIYEYLREEPNKEQIQFLIFVDPEDRTTGEKRNIIIENANSDYFCFIDDDDLVSPHYFKEILNKINHPIQVDGIGFSGIVFRFDEKNNLHEFYKFTHTMQCQFKHWEGEPFKTRHFNTLNHLNPIKMDLVKQVKFKDLVWSEDVNYWEEMKDLVKSEYFINKDLYYYLWRGNHHD